ncbi:MAG: hypothetical protein C0594_04280 [Marinilabiliales bacterium]|nr:MAG: hypothetical protein C0594_04280 [Marinilabiliales bacterium]
MKTTTTNNRTFKVAFLFSLTFIFATCITQSFAQTKAENLDPNYEHGGGMETGLNHELTSAPNALCEWWVVPDEDEVVVTVDNGGEIGHVLQFQIYDITGKIVHQSSAKPNSKIYREHFDATSMSTGIYIARIHTNGKTETKKFYR